MIRPEARFAPWGIAIACVMAIGAYLSAFVSDAPPIAAVVVLALATALMLAAFVALGVGDHGFRRGPVAAALAVLIIAVGGGISTALLIGAPTGPESSLLGGLPLGAAVVLYGVGLIPALIVPLLYAIGFDDDGREE